MSGPTNRESDKFMLRLPDGMRDRIKAAADKNNRSMNAEIVATLEEKYPPLRIKKLELLRAFLELDLDEQKAVLDAADDGPFDDRTTRLFKAFVETQEKLGHRLPSDHLDALIDMLKSAKSMNGQEVDTSDEK